MEQWYNDHVDYPYASYDTVQQIVQDSCITHSQVRNWLANRRKRSCNTGHWQKHIKRRDGLHPYAQRPTRQPDNKTSTKCAFKKSNSSRPIELKTLAEAVGILREWTRTHQLQTPTDFQLEYLALQTGLPTSNVRAWFAENSRVSSSTKQLPGLNHGIMQQLYSDNLMLPFSMNVNYV